MGLEIVPKTAKWMVYGGEYYCQGLGVTSAVTKWTELKTPVPFLQISSGDVHCLAISEDGKLWSWGGNEYGQLGFGDKKERLSPSQVPFDQLVASVSAGHQYFSVVLSSNLEHKINFYRGWKSIYLR